MTAPVLCLKTVYIVYSYGPLHMWLTSLDAIRILSVRLWIKRPHRECHRLALVQLTRTVDPLLSPIQSIGSVAPVLPVHGPATTAPVRIWPGQSVSLAFGTLISHNKGCGRSANKYNRGENLGAPETIRLGASRSSANRAVSLIRTYRSKVRAYRLEV